MNFGSGLFFIFILLFSSGCSTFFYYPDSELYSDPEKFGFKLQTHSFSSLDGTKLNAWLFRNTAKTYKGTVILFHGNAENISSHYTSLVWLTKEGYDLFAFDYRGYGLSESKPSAKGLYEDGMAALDYAWALFEKNPKHTKNSKFIVYGQSLGGIVALRALADFRHQRETALVVADSTFVSFKDMIQEKMASFFVTWIFSPLGRLSVSDRYASVHTLPKLQTRLLVIHDKHDPIVDFQNGKKLFETAPAHLDKTFWKIDSGSHVGFFYLDTQEHKKQFLDFIDKK